MSERKFVVLITSILIITVSTLIFVRNNNDHKECTNEITILPNNKGEKVKVDKHICKEKYNF